MIDAHPPVPLMKLIEHVGIDLEKVERRGIGKTRGFHETEQQEEIVQLGGLQAQLTLVSTVSCAVKKVADVVAKGHIEIIVPFAYWPIRLSPRSPALSCAWDREFRSADPQE